ncbi:MAG TPA: SRPBCC domain-containing protein [Usitatibacteraceae bacterium]|nr:SRPBCC domain-containing protein [Usitatibacteraceae bacterium]
MRNAAFFLASVALVALPHDAGAQAPDPDRRVVKQVTVKAPVADVWKAWTTTEGIVSFFAPSARVEARPGGPFEIHFNPYAKPGLKGADDMVVLAVQEGKMLSFTWNSPPHLAQVRPQRTAVQVRFRPAGDGETEVRLVHGGWGEGGQWDESFKYFETAWGRVLANLQKRFADGPIDWTEYRARVKAYQDAEDAKAATAGKP